MRANFHINRSLIYACIYSVFNKRASILPTRRKTLSNQSINQSINQIKSYETQSLIKYIIYRETISRQYKFSFCLFWRVFAVAHENFGAMSITTDLCIPTQICHQYELKC